MPEEQITEEKVTPTNEDGQVTSEEIQKYLDEIAQLKKENEDAMAKASEENKKLREENNTLFKSLKHIDPTKGTTEKVDIRESANEAREALLKGGKTDLETFKTIMKYREAVLKEKNEDVFAPKVTKIGTNGKPYTQAASKEDRERAKAYAEGIQECIDKCGDNPRQFLRLMGQTFPDMSE